MSNERPDEVTTDEIADALNSAWADWVSDTGCYPDCLTREGRDRISADFRRSNFASHVASWLNVRRAAAAVRTGGEPDERPTTAEIAEVFDSLRMSLTTSSKDMGRDRQDAWCYGVVAGWTDDEDPGDALTEVADRHRWDTAERDRIERLHRIVKRVMAAGEGTGSEHRGEPT